MLGTYHLLIYNSGNYRCWKSNQQPYGVDCATVHYPVTTQTPEGTFTTVITFYVCEDIGLNIVLGQDYTEHCSAASGAFSVFESPVMCSQTHH